MKIRLVATGVFALALAPTAMAADMPVKARVYTAPPPVFSWTGVYVGGDLGGAWTSTSTIWSPLPSPIAFGIFPIAATDRGSGFVGGIHAGYDYQFAPTWVAGLEGDWSWTKTRGGFTQQWLQDPPAPSIPGQFTAMSTTLDWLASVRGRLGYLVMPNLLAYATGGAAWGRIDYVGNDFNSVATGPTSYFTNTTSSGTKSGYAVGGGLEWAMTNNWLIRAEYLYYRFSGGQNVVVASLNGNFVGFASNYTWSSTNVSVGRAGLSYKF